MTRKEKRDLDNTVIYAYRNDDEVIFQLSYKELGKLIQFRGEKEFHIGKNWIIESLKREL